MSAAVMDNPTNASVILPTLSSMDTQASPTAVPTATPAMILPTPIPQQQLTSSTQTPPLEDLTPLKNMRIQRGTRPEPEIDWEKLRTLYVMDEMRNKIKFTDIFKKQKTIIFFVRHFLDFISKEYVDDLAMIPLEYLQNADVRLVVIGPADPVFIRSFKEATRLNYTLYTDPEREVYKALGCLENLSTGELSNSKHIKSGVLTGVTSSIWRAMTSPEKKLQGEPKQQGGTFIFGPDEQVHFSHADQSSADHCPINDALDVAGVTNVSFPKDPRVQTI